MNNYMSQHVITSYCISHVSISLQLSKQTPNTEDTGSFKQH